MCLDSDNVACECEPEEYIDPLTLEEMVDVLWDEIDAVIAEREDNTEEEEE